ncbi:MAG TPA: DUF58 domain-containing protein [Gemmataceae bacterium]|nr:DUF58 domain-containing protein [Gemmataceae bacterium]
MALFDSDFLKKLEYLSLISKRVFRGSLMAQRRTMQLGTGIEFADHREYTPGDDFRYIDWNLFARLDELLLKRFQEEEDLHVYFLLDCSRSMAFGEPPKFDFARQVAAALAYIALADLDRIAVIGFADDIVADFPLTRGKGRILSLLKFLETLEPSGADTNLERVATGFIHREQRRGLAVVVSDLYDSNGFQRGLDLLRHRRYEPHIVQIHDRYEKEPADMLGDVEMWDVESGMSRKVTVTEKNLRHYHQLFHEFQTQVQGYCNRHGLGCTRTTTDIPFDQLILRMMRQAGAVR